ncbi:SDR family NAD(P)-dependent oxidoreductase [Cyclobacterium marinum]|uniref:Short-chain dehydrogenase/reductase SDR n=1 Tax=Cyclobacterium marinum (strain ATCC 25205 / DSM 745 / LMG 13164 / NCIMB 1802) TaxID=880070 RepID=G0J7V1_CYCMS|nr:SDR family NAD(P)-dependent oxidoreductase [Cyclobacterium marinum]AEL27799.1 short-chain dehydrogenase/reductase SDR [Cyclobacterium marinum DSM 745]
MKNKICLITGANAGIGFETAKALSSKGFKVILVCRTEEKAKMAMEKILIGHAEAELDYALADLSSQAEIRNLAKNIITKYPVLDVLINNAGIWYSDMQLTADGIERQWAINHLAPFLLSHLLLPSLSKAKDPRIITVSSDSHFHGKIHFEDVNLTNNYHGLRAYAQSKLANVLFTKSFEKLKPNKKLSIYAVQPGLVKTDIGLKHTFSFHGLMWKLRRLTGKTPAKGAATSVFLALDKSVKGISGKYWDKCKPKPCSKKANSSPDADQLWGLSCEQCGIADYFGNIVQ